MPFEARVSPARTLLLLIGALAFVAASVWLIRLPTTPENETGVRIIGWVSIAFFGLCALILVPRLFQAGIELRVNGLGISWRRWSDQIIPWSAIRAIDSRQVRSQHFLCLWLVDPAAFPSTKLVGRLAATNRAMGFGDIAITVAGTDRRFKDLLEAVKTHAPRAIVTMI